MAEHIPDHFQSLFSENERMTAPSEGKKQLEVGALTCQAGGQLDSVTIAYETWGELNADRSNAILVCHAISGDSHAIGWWDKLVGPGKAIDTDRFFVICSNVLGGCQGTTGPSSIAPNGKPYGTSFPIITIGDMVEVQRRLIDHLGIDRLACVAGGSMGGMQALEWSLRFADRVEKAFITASSSAHSAMQIGFNETARQAIMRDPEWQDGHYEGDGPVHGLAVARMLGHLTYLSEPSFETKFSRRLQDKPAPDYHLGIEFQVESYLRHQGDKFTKRFDANSLLYLSRAVDYFEHTSLAGASAKYLIVSYSSDWLYPTWQSAKIQQLAEAAGLSSRHIEIDLSFGHDSFLLDEAEQGRLLTQFLAA